MWLFTVKKTIFFSSAKLFIEVVQKSVFILKICNIHNIVIVVKHQTLTLGYRFRSASKLNVTNSNSKMRQIVGKSAAMRESYEDASSPTSTLQPGRGSYQDPGSRRNPLAALYSSMNGSYNMDREASYSSPSDYQVRFLNQNF